MSEATEKLWEMRHEPEILAQLERELSAAPAEFAAFWQRARLRHFQAMQALERDETGEAQSLYAAGFEEGKRAIEADSIRVEARFWAGVNRLEAARLQGSVAALAALPGALKDIERAEKLDETYHFAGPLRVQGRIMHHKPLLLGGSLDRAMAHFERALQVVPGNSTTLYYYAETLRADQRWKQLRAVLAQIIQAPRDEKWVWEQARDKERARKMVEELG